jgi:hypothetical protein
MTPRPAVTTLATLLALLLSGCGTSPPVVSLVSLQSHKTFKETFTQAFTSRDAAGDYQVVLLHDPLDDVPASEAGKPLQATRVPPVRQVLQVRVLWRPAQGAKPDSPASTNAALHWYVLGGPTAEGTSVLHYAGTAFVAVIPNGPGAEVTISNGSLKLVERFGELVDPLKAFKLSGRFDAVADDARVRQVIADVKSVVGEARVNANHGPETRPSASEARAPAND